VVQLGDKSSHKALKDLKYLIVPWLCSLCQAVTHTNKTINKKRLKSFVRHYFSPRRMNILPIIRFRITYKEKEIVPSHAETRVCECAAISFGCGLNASLLLDAIRSDSREYRN